jgi:hypothetical protein
MVFSIVGGFGAGIVASYVVWLLIARFHLPRIDVSDICRDHRSIEPLRYRYRVKIRNPSRRRSVGDLNLAARLVIRGLHPSQPDGYTAFRLRLADTHPFPVLEPGEGRIYTFKPIELEADGTATLPGHIRTGLETGHISLEALMGLGTDAFVRFAVSGSHEIGGLYRTSIRRFTVDDMVPGWFPREDSVDIERAGDPGLLPANDSDASEPTGL